MNAVDTADARRASGSWTPPAGVVGHDGMPIGADEDFFVPPPPEVGQVVSAYSTLSKRRRPHSVLVRLLPGGLAFVVPFVLISTLLSGWDMPGSDYKLNIFWGLAAAIIIGPITWHLMTFRGTCTYVGTTGAARCRIAGSREATPKSEVLAFESAAELRALRAREYQGVIYMRTNYKSIWTDAARRTLMKLEGDFRGDSMPNSRKASYWFAYAAELAWSRYLLERMEALFPLQGFLQFNLPGRKWVRVGEGYIEFGDFGPSERIEKQNIESMKVTGGYFRLKQKESNFITRQGYFKFRYADLGNARVFLLWLERLLGWNAKSAAIDEEGST